MLKPLYNLLFKKNSTTIEKIRFLIFVVYFLLIFEGVLRKWIFPSFSNYLFFVRDPFVLLIYFLALKTDIYKKFSLPVYFGIALSCFGAVLGLFQLFNAKLPMFILAYGWRNYFFLIPLAGIIENVFTEFDFRRLIKFTCYISIPSFFLCFLQSISPATSFLNTGSGLGANKFRTMGVDSQFIRPAGFFTSSFGQSLFLTCLFAFLIIIYLKWKTKKIQINASWFNFILALAIFSVAISGQRGTIFNILVVLACSNFMATFLSRTKFRILLRMSLSLFLISIIALLIFPKHLNALKQRFLGGTETTAHSRELKLKLTIARLTGPATLFLDRLHDIPIQGYGLGAASNAAGRLRLTNARYEDEWSKHIMELGPVFGFLFICFRVFLCLFIGMKSFVYCKKNNDITPFTLFSVIGVLLFYAQLCGNGLAAGYVWFFIGLILNTTNFGKNYFITNDINQSFL
jgi:hypothetical protein